MSLNSRFYPWLMGHVSWLQVNSYEASWNFKVQLWFNKKIEEKHLLYVRPEVSVRNWRFFCSFPKFCISTFFGFLSFYVQLNILSWKKSILRSSANRSKLYHPFFVLSYISIFTCAYNWRCNNSNFYFLMDHQWWCSTLTHDQLVIDYNL